MTIMHRPSEARGRENLGWLDSRHSFSFGHYYDPKHMGFRSLRVINDDTVAPGGGFPTHGHRDMEIISYVVQGGLAHRDTTGGQGLLSRGDVQAMSAGTGVRHSEFNASDDDPATDPTGHGANARFDEENHDLPLFHTGPRAALDPSAARSQTNL